MTRNRHDAGFSLIELMITVGIIGVISAFALPMMATTMANFRVSGDAHSVANTMALAKMRAASDFSWARLYVELDGAHHLQRFNRTSATCCWITEGGNVALSYGVSFGHGIVTNTPPNAATLNQAPLCKDDAGADIGNTACVIFNSRGTPITSAGAPTAIDALYITDGNAVYGVNVTATGMIRTWRAFPRATAAWMLQ